MKNQLKEAQKNFSTAHKSLGMWDGISSRGQKCYDAMFNAEMQMAEAAESKSMEYDEVSALMDVENQYED